MSIERVKQLQLHIVGLEEAMAQCRDRIKQLEAERDAAHKRGMEDAAKIADAHASQLHRVMQYYASECIRDLSAAIRAKIGGETQHPRLAEDRMIDMFLRDKEPQGYKRGMEDALKIAESGYEYVEGVIHGISERIEEIENGS